MGDALAARISDVLRTLADLAPSSETHSGTLSIPTEWFRWLPAGHVTIFQRQYLRTGVADHQDPAAWPTITIDREYGERLAAVDQVRSGSRSLRVGWLFVAGQMVDEDGRRRKVFHPLITSPVRVALPPFAGKAQLVATGDAEITPLVSDHKKRNALEHDMEFGGGALGSSDVMIDPALLDRLHRLENFARDAARTAGLPAPWLVPVTDGPDGLMSRHDLVIVAGVGIYAVHEVGGSSRASSLRAWAAGPLERKTAFHSLYLEPEQELEPTTAPKHTVESPYLLTPSQRAAVISSRNEPITLISGAPGNGKSHTIVAIACDALGNGERVLIAAKSDATVDALVDLLERGPGPDPVVFGSNERRTLLANRLSGGQLRPTTDEAVEAARQRFEAQAGQRDQLREHVAGELARELHFEGGDATNRDARDRAPGLFDPDTDLDKVEHLLHVATRPWPGWMDKRRARKAFAELTRIVRADPLPTPKELRSHLRTARAASANPAGAEGELDLGAAWADLLAAEDDARRARGAWLEAEGRSRRRLNASTLGAVAAVATALRSGRAARRAQLSILDDERLTRALPLWVGTLADIDDLLPAVPALFDLVILDEGSSIDQPLAATALLRGGRAVVAGDPHQLRQVSFVSDEEQRAAVKDHHLSDSSMLAARVDVRRNSIFDVAAGSTTVHVLDEHFRSSPHLVQFVADELYDGALQIATRTPRTHSKDCVEVVRLSGTRDSDGVVGAEVDWIVRSLRDLCGEGRKSIGVVTPFRAQADAIEDAVLRGFGAAQLKDMDLRIGTAHAFQGNERDLMIASIGVGASDNAATWRFVEDPHLLAVLLTRARQTMIVVVSAEPPADGLVARYLAQADDPPGPPPPVSALSPWAASIADDLATGGLAVLSSYPTGRHQVDICVDEPWRCVGIECGVHPAGADAHIDRRLALMRGGWDLLDAYPSGWSERRAELVVNLLAKLRTG